MALFRSGGGKEITKATKVTSSFPYTITEDGLYLIYIGGLRPSTYKGDPSIDVTGTHTVLMDSGVIWAYISSDCGFGRTQLIRAKKGATVSLTLYNWSIGSSGKYGISRLE